MGHGYAILLCDGFGHGLVRINPRLHVEGTDLYGNPKNWWACDGDETDDELRSRHDIPDGVHWTVIR